MDAETKRKLGILPQIEIAGEHFFIDLRLQELRHVRDFTPILSLKKFTLTEDSEQYWAFYHLMLRQIIDIDPKLTEFPDNVILIKIPNELGLDPIGAARIYGIDDVEVLKEYPIRENLKAEVVPLSETQVPAWIAANRKALQQEHKQIKRTHRLRRRPRF